MSLVAEAKKLSTRFACAVTTVFLIAGAAIAQTDKSFAPIYVDADNSEIFYLVGDIDARTAFNFKRAISKYGRPTELVLTRACGHS